MELAKGRDVVEAGIGPGVGDHDQPLAHQHSATIGHFRIPEVSRQRELVANFARRSNPIRARCRRLRAILSSPAQAGDPVNAEVENPISSTEYWMPHLRGA